MGHEIVSSWLTEREGVTYANVTEGYRLACALRDRSDIDKCEIFVLDSIDETPRGGRETELGLASRAGKFCIVVGPFRNVFHRFAHRHFDDWEKCLEFLAKIKIA